MELYSKRKKAAENPPTALRFDLPIEFRHQVWFIWGDALGYVQQPQIYSPFSMRSFESVREDLICNIYSEINRTLCEEHGINGLPGNGPCNALYQWFLQAETDVALDIIQSSFSMKLQLEHNHNFQNIVQPSLTPESAISKLNRRFQEHAIGYRYELGQIIRIDSEFLNTETTEPALQLLFEQGYEGALAEFQLAHEHYREGETRYDDCLTNCLKSLESVLKTICRRHNWTYKESDSSSKLLGVVFEKGLIPNYLQSHFDGLRATLESGVPTIRNREGGHGSGERPNNVPEYLVAYQLHLTASATVLLVRANAALGKPSKK